MTTNRFGRGFAIALMMATAGGCSPSSDSPMPDALTGVRVALAVGSPVHDVAAVRYGILLGASPCDGVPIKAATVSLQGEPLPQSSLSSGLGPHHSFADAFFVLLPGEYTVCATPLTPAGLPSEICGVASSIATVNPGVTSEIVLVSQCQGPRPGGLDAVNVFNTPPQITAVHFDPGTFVKTCESVTISVTATDADGDELQYFWLVDSPFLSPPPFTSTPTATFSTWVPGDYTITVFVDEVGGPGTSLSFPIHFAKKEGCSDICPPLTVESTGFCWLVGTGELPVGFECQQTGPGLSGQEGPVPGLPWTPELMAEITAGLGCTNGGISGCGQSTLWLDRQTNTCFTQAFSGDYVNEALSLDGALPIHACRPTLPPPASAQAP